MKLRCDSPGAHDPAGVENEINCMNEWGNRKPLHEDTNLLKKTRLDTGNVFILSFSIQMRSNDPENFNLIN